MEQEEEVRNQQEEGEESGRAGYGGQPRGGTTMMMYDHTMGVSLGLHRRKPSRVESAKRMWRVSEMSGGGRRSCTGLEGALTPEA